MRIRTAHDEKTVMSRVQDKDEELGKRDDEYSRRIKSQTSTWLPVKPRKRRVVLVVVFIAVVWLLFQALPPSPTGLGGRVNDDDAPSDLPEDRPAWVPGRNRDTTVQQDVVERPQKKLVQDKSNAEDKSKAEDKSNAPVRPPAPPPSKSDFDQNSASVKHAYNGIVNFYELSGSLYKISRIIGRRSSDNNVLFAASDSKSLAAILPFACEMRKFERNRVHVAIFGRHDMTLEELQQLNGVDNSTCDVYWHDARPDFAPFSTDLRAENAVLLSYRSINDYLHPQVVFTDDLSREDAFFKRAITRISDDKGITIIQIPKDGSEKLMWMTRLDVDPLKGWHYASIDIVIQAPADSIGSLRRLMKSLEEADYTGLDFPRITLEVPADGDYAMRRYVEQIRWPPRQPTSLTHINMLNIRYRIPSQSVSSEAAAVHFVESFYPGNSGDNHVLALSPHAQVSPLYYHYLKFALLQYKRSDRLFEGDVDNLFGIALDVPSLTPDGSSFLKAPTAASLKSDHDLNVSENAKIPFLWEAPSSGAALFFGDRWLEFHSFIASRTTPREQLKPRDKVVSAVFPSWMEYFLELARARGYSMLYPALHGGATLAIVHHETSRLPEEFDPLTAGKSTFDPFITPNLLPKPLPESPDEQNLFTSGSPLHETLLFGGDLPALQNFPYLTYNGAEKTRSNAAKDAESFAQAFQKDYGGCESNPRFQKGQKRKRFGGTTRDLFCWGDETDFDWVSETKSVIPEATKDIDGFDFDQIPESKVTKITPEPKGINMEELAEKVAAASGDEVANGSERASEPLAKEEMK